LVQGQYQLQLGEPCWMPEIGLGIGRYQLQDDPFERTVLSWFDEGGDRYLTEAEATKQRLAAEQQRAEQLAQRLRELGEEV